MRKSLVTLLAAFTLPTAVNASVPYLYVNGGTMGDYESVNECVEIATREMKIAGFTKIVDSYLDEKNKKQATIIADHSWRPVTITYRCFEDLKVYAWGVSAIDNDDAYESYIDMNNAFGKSNAY